MELTIDGLDQFEQLETFWGLWWPTRALQLTGEAIVEDARLRLEDDETSPDGDQWDPWSDDYAKTRGAGDKLLFQKSTGGALAKSLDSKVRGNMVEVGSPLPYALTHQFGSRDGNTPAREYVGISRELEVGLESIYEADFNGGWLAVRV